MKLKDFDYKLLFSVKVNLEVKRATTTKTIKLGFYRPLTANSLRTLCVRISTFQRLILLALDVVVFRLV